MEDLDHGTCGMKEWPAKTLMALMKRKLIRVLSRYWRAKFWPDGDLFKGRNFKRFMVVNVENAAEDVFCRVNLSVKA